MTEQPMKWVLGPNVTGSSDAAEQAAPRRPKRVEARHQDSPEPRYQPVIRRSAVSACCRIIQNISTQLLGFALTLGQTVNTEQSAHSPGIATQLTSSRKQFTS